ncbi:pectinesterase-like [Diospyros lotus]|uniref:pectinesterase-like n=1 Tax=Diospyros lotus TaxID=55363 RepID=UPI0022521096|nr:pectinesterase-like [Diospyros lotus]
MASMHYSTSCCIASMSLILTLSFFSPSLATSPICSSTPFPSMCNSILPDNQSATTCDHGRFLIHRSLEKTMDFQSLVNGYLKLQYAVPQNTIQALEDCRFLIDLNMDFLSNVGGAVGFTDNLQSPLLDETYSLLSAVLTNHQTCLDGLQATSSASSIQNAVSAPLYNGSLLYSISLAVFRLGWARNSRTGRWLTEEGHATFSNFLHSGELASTMASQDQKRYELLSGRKLQQTIGNKVKVNSVVVVSQDGSGDFTTISDAVTAAPNNTDVKTGYYLIYVTAGIYEEYVSIPKYKKYLMMIGEGINKTIITGNHSVVDGWTTFNSATFAVVGQGFVGLNLTIRNTAGAEKHQAVALRSDADLSAFYQCSFEGYQDTLYTHSLRQFYRECDVYGTVDFIFGNAAVVLQKCNLYPRLPLQGQFNTITAQGRTDINQNTGISIHNCSITAAPDLASSNGTTQTFLGRPWKQYSRTVYMQSFMDSLIDPAGWAAWSGDFALDTLYYAEYDNMGPGSDTSNRVDWPGYHVINSTDAANFTVSNFISGDDWLPATGVPYTATLL